MEIDDREMLPDEKDERDAEKRSVRDVEERVRQLEVDADRNRGRRFVIPHLGLRQDETREVTHQLGRTPRSVKIEVQEKRSDKTEYIEVSGSKAFSIGHISGDLVNGAFDASGFGDTTVTIVYATDAQEGDPGFAVAPIITDAIVEDEGLNWDGAIATGNAHAVVFRYVQALPTTATFTARILIWHEPWALSGDQTKVYEGFYHWHARGPAVTVKTPRIVQPRPATERLIYLESDRDCIVTITLEG